MTEAATRKQKVRYRYDALGRRVTRNLGGGRELTKFTYDGDDVILDDNDGTLAKYLNGQGRIGVRPAIWRFGEFADMILDDGTETED
jgi:YD repeat-containing protein